MFGYVAIGQQQKLFLWRDCGDSSKSAFVEKLDIYPDPLRFGQNAYWNFTLNVLRELPADTQIGITLWRTISIFGLYPLEVRLPCMFGSDCRTNLRHFIRHCDLAKGDCNKSLDIGRYTHVDQGFIPNNPLITAAVQGLYKARIVVTDVEGAREFGCLNVQTGIFTQEMQEMRSNSIE